MGHYLVEGHSPSPRVMIPVTRAFHETTRSGAHGFRSHRLRSLFMLCKYCRIRVKSSFPGFPRKRKVDCFALAFLLLTGLAQPIAAVPRNACLEWFLLLVLPLFELKT